MRIPRSAFRPPPPFATRLLRLERLPVATGKR
jgi:hypothetical protein